jgi:hypothetical protein
MVYVVERYLPGLSRSELLRGLSRLEQAVDGEPYGVRYLDSTIVLRDEACYCRFEGPTEAAIAEANRRAGLPFDRIVPAVTIKSERRGSMSVLTTTQATVEIRRDRLVGLIAGVAVLAAAVTWALSTYAVSTGSGKAHTSGSGAVAPAVSVQPAVGSGNREALIMSITPAALAAGALGGYALPSAHAGPTTAQILASMSPATRQWTRKVMSLTFAQLKGGAAGWP